MKRVVVVIRNGRPTRAFANSDDAQEYVSTAPRMESDVHEVWDLPIGLTMQTAKKLADTVADDG